MNLERDLERAVRPQSPEPGFADRVMARIENGEAVEEDDHPSDHSARRWRTIAASLTLTVLLGGYTTHRVVENRRGERAKEQVLEAMRIASEKVAVARHEVRAIGSHP